MTRILLIGAGAIADEYIKALHALGHKDIGVLSRRQESADALAAKFPLIGSHGGGEAALPPLLKQYDAYIVAPPIETLATYAKLFAAMNIKQVLLEKPAFLFSHDLQECFKRYPEWNAAV